MAHFPYTSVPRHAVAPFLIVAMALILTISSAAAAGSHERAVIGEWRFTAALDGADVASLDEKEARQLVGQVFTVSKKSVNFGDRTCGPSEFEAQRVEPRLFLREQFHADAAGLGLPTPVTVVDLSCTSVFIKSANKIVIFWRGWFFEAARVKR